MVQLPVQDSWLDGTTRRCLSITWKPPWHSSGQEESHKAGSRQVADWWMKAGTHIKPLIFKNPMKFETFDISFYHDTLNQLNHDLKAVSASPEQMLQLVQMCQSLFNWAANSSLQETDVNLPKIMLSTKFARSDHSSSGTHHDSLYWLNLNLKPIFEEVRANAPVGKNMPTPAQSGGKWQVAGNRRLLKI